MKNPRLGAHPVFARRAPRGFALVVSLSLMVLLTVLAVGLLGLSSLSLATSTRQSELAEARANARMALAMAIAQLQKQTGPDQRVTTTADQLAASGGDQTSATPGRRHWTGVYNSWGSTSTSRPSPQFRSWLVSGETKDTEQVDTAKGSSGSGATVKLVGTGTVGNAADGIVEVPALTVASPAGGDARFAWWTGDQGTKAAMATPPPSNENVLASVRSSLQGAPRNALELASSANSGKPFASLDLNDPRVATVTGWQQSAFLASDKDSPRSLFHDVAPFSSGLLTNLRTGGFRKDLSMQLERAANVANSQLVSSRTALYKAGGENGINLHELWGYYNLYKDVKTSGSYRYTTGGTLSSGTPHLLVDAGPAACAGDDDFFFKQPTIISYQMALSFGTRPDSSGQNVLHVYFDPIITFWNPLDIPVVIPTSSFFSVKYFAVPYDVIVTVGGVSHTCPLIRSLSSGDSNFLSLIAGDPTTQQLVFKPGEVIKVSQLGGMTAGGVQHQLKAKAGFNYGNGLYYPLKNSSGQTIAVGPNASLRYEARANGFTAGQATTGKVPDGYHTHTRHFSTTHHEVYVGYDRKSNNQPSLGYGTMAVDWDFGNRRLKPSELRAESQPGTKPANQRFFANTKTTFFTPIAPADGRPLSAVELAGRKAPFMILSFNAKTEVGTNPNARTRYLGRFNPKAHHVDFYDLTEAERDILPYEYTADPLISWKNRSLETSTTGNAYFGGGMNAELGNSFVTTHSIPREPIVSLGALQHSFANGFEILRPKDGYATLNAREPLLPQISHAIGNSVAPPMLGPGQTEGSLAGGRPLADHSYLANLNLWDDWFFSGISPQNYPARHFAKQRAQRLVAQEFLQSTAKLPVVRYQPDTDGQDVNKLLTAMFSGANPTEAATQLAASLIRVDGLFNVNSTSVEAWKTVLGGLKGREIVTRSLEGGESMKSSGQDEIPVSGLHSPRDLVADGDSAMVTDDSQWVGRRVLSEDDIDRLARAIVREVRKRGPFLSLADFVNRRPGSDRDLARAGAIQSALDDDATGINSAWLENGRGVSNTVAGRFSFPEAERGPSGYGMPGIVKQGDILTPIAPILSARSDSFIIRAYGESVDKNGKVLARAWCEATVQRDNRFVDEIDKPETLIANLQADVNKTFGRRYDIVSFRWLHADEI